MITGVLYVDYHVEAISFRNKKKAERGEVLKMIAQDLSCEYGAVKRTLIPQS